VAINNCNIGLFRTVKNLFKLLGDIWVFYVPQNHSNEMIFAFLVHPRDINDFYTQYPAFRHMPVDWVKKLMLIWPPITLTPIKGIKSVQDGQPIKGWLLATTLLPSLMRQKPKLTSRKISRLVQLAEKKGAKVIGLGALIPSMTRYGKSLKPHCHKSALTTGHSYTAYTICRYVEKVMETKGWRPENITIAIVGAAGSTGTITTEVLADRFLAAKILLVDREKRLLKLKRMAQEIQNRNNQHKEIAVSVSTELTDLKQAKIVIVVTNADCSILKTEHLAKEAVLIDDSQPRNTSENLLEKVSIIDVRSQIPNLDCSFEMGLIKERPGITYTCLAETAILAAHHWPEHFSLGTPKLAKAKKISALAEKVGIEPAPFNAFGKILKKI
jgi:predicted amino acid dehydrogenase